MWISQRMIRIGRLAVLPMLLSCADLRAKIGCRR